MTCKLVNIFCEEFAYSVFNVFFKISAQKPPWSEAETQFSYAVISGDDKLISKTEPSRIPSYLPQPPVTTQQDITYSEYQDTSYQQFENNSYQQYEDQQFNEQYNTPEQYLDQYQDQTDFQQQPYDYQYQYQDDQQKQKYGEEQNSNQQYPQQDSYQQDQYQQQQQEFQKQQQQFEQQQQTQQQQLRLQQQQLQQHQLQQQQQQQQKQQQPAQQLQTTVLTGAATLGSLMAGGAKKLGSFFGAAAAAVAPAISQPSAHVPAATAPVSLYTSAIAPVTPFTSTTSVPIASVPEVSPSVPVSAITTTPVTLPRTPSLKRQESIQRPPVRRTRTLPEAPEDLPPSSYESAYEDDYQKTDSDQLLERDRTSLDRYHDDEQYLQDSIPEEVTEEEHLHDQTILSPSRQKASPTRTVTQTVRKPSVDSYHSQTPSMIDRKPSQSSFHLEEPHAIPTTQEGKFINVMKYLCHLLLFLVTILQCSVSLIES